MQLLATRRSLTGVPRIFLGKVMGMLHSYWVEIFLGFAFLAAPLLTLGHWHNWWHHFFKEMGILKPKM